MRNTMVMLASTYDQLFSSYAKIWHKDEAQSCQKWLQLNFDDRLEFGDLKNTPAANLFKWNKFKKITLTVRAFSVIFDDSKIFAKMPYPLVKFDEKHDGKVGGCYTTNPSWVMPEFCAKIWPRAAKNGSSSILMTDSNSTTSKTLLAAVLSKLNEFDKMVEKTLLIRAFWAIFDDFKISSKVEHY